MVYNTWVKINRNMQNTMKNLIKTAVAIFAVAIVIIAPKAAFANQGYDYYADYGGYGDYGGYDSYADYGGYGDYGYDSYADYGGYGDYGYDSYEDYGGYDTYADYGGYGDYSGYDYYDTYDTYADYDYGGYDSYADYGYASYQPYSYGSSNYGYGSYMPYGQQSCPGGCGSTNTSTSKPIITNTNTNVDSHNYSNYVNTVTNTSIKNTNTNTCSNGQNCNTTNNQVAQTPQNTLSGTCPTTGTYNIGQTVTWTASASGGTGNYTYSWSGDVSGSNQSVSQTYGSAGTRTANVVITSGGQSITRSCSVTIQGNNNYNNLGGYCYATPNSVTVGQQVTWFAYGSGGNGNYTYNWSGAVSGYGNNIVTSYSYPGTQNATVRITDSTGQSTTQSCQINVGNYYGGTTYVPPTTGVLTSGVLLSSIPYTGLSYGMKMTLFILGMILWSAFMAWILMRKKLAKKGVVAKATVSKSDMIAKFKAENLARKQALA